MRTRYLVLMVGIAAVTAIALVLTRSAGFSARAEPSGPERLIARAVRRLAVPRGAREARNPVAFTPQVWNDGRGHFADHCASCHGNDGRGKTGIGQRLYPKAPDMHLPDTQRLTDGELYWIIENGVRLTGMPAWGDGTANDTDTWHLVHFVRHLDDLTAEQIQDMERLNPTTRSALEEEQQDRDFLEGTRDDPPAPNPSHHHPQKEQP